MRFRCFLFLVSLGTAATWGVDRARRCKRCGWKNRFFVSLGTAAVGFFLQGSQQLCVDPPSGVGSNYNLPRSGALVGILRRWPR